MNKDNIDTARRGCAHMVHRYDLFAVSAALTNIIAKQLANRTIQYRTYSHTSGCSNRTLCNVHKSTLIPVLKCDINSELFHFVSYDRGILDEAIVQLVTTFSQLLDLGIPPYSQRTSPSPCVGGY